jgi:hypothetical protein
VRLPGGELTRIFARGESSGTGASAGARQAHTAQPDWAPPIVPARWQLEQ